MVTFKICILLCHFKLVVLNSSLVIGSPFDLKSLSFLHFGKKQSAIISLILLLFHLFFEGWINSFSTCLGDSQLFSMPRKFLSSLSSYHCFSFFLFFFFNVFYPRPVFIVNMTLFQFNNLLTQNIISDLSSFNFSDYLVNY